MLRIARTTSFEMPRMSPSSSVACLSTGASDRVVLNRNWQVLDVFLDIIPGPWLDSQPVSRSLSDVNLAKCNAACAVSSTISLSSLFSPGLSRLSSLQMAVDLPTPMQPINAIWWSQECRKSVKRPSSRSYKSICRRKTLLRSGFSRRCGFPRAKFACQRLLRLGCSKAGRPSISQSSRRNLPNSPALEVPIDLSIESSSSSLTGLPPSSIREMLAALVLKVTFSANCSWVSAASSRSRSSTRPMGIPNLPLLSLIAALLKGFRKTVNAFKTLQNAFRSVNGLECMNFRRLFSRRLEPAWSTRGPSFSAAESALIR